MQRASAVHMQPAICLLGKTLQLLETMLGGLSGEPVRKFARRHRSYSRLSPAR